MENRNGTVSRKRKAAYIVIYLFFLMVFLLVAGEIFVRFRGYKPWRQEDAHITVEPGGTFFKKHPTLGYTHLPGTFTVTLDSGYTFTVTHLPTTLRITRPIDSTATDTLKKAGLWILGCSFAHGWSLNDSETFPWLLQQRFPEYDVVNFGVSGYGTIHSLLQLKDLLKTEHPAVVVLTYADFHDERNTFTRRRRKTIAPWNRLGPLVQPRARLDKAGNLSCEIADVEYRPLPFMKQLALINFIDEKYNAIIEPKLYKNQQVSEMLVREMADLLEKNGISFVLANICRAQVMQQFVDKNGINNVDMSVDLENPENNNLPYDSHPSALANRHYADKLEQYLREKIIPEGQQPTAP